MNCPTEAEISGNLRPNSRRLMLRPAPQKGIRRPAKIISKVAKVASILIRDRPQAGQTLADTHHPVLEGNATQFAEFET